MSCGSTAPPSVWMTSKLCESFIRLQKSTNVPARRPFCVSMMFGGPDVGARQTCLPPTGVLNSGSSAWKVNALGVVASAFATRPRSMRTTCVASSTVAPACA